MSLALSALLHLALVAWIAPHLQPFTGGPSRSPAMGPVLSATLTGADTGAAGALEPEAPRPVAVPTPGDDPLADREPSPSPPPAPPRQDHHSDDTPKAARRGNDSRHALRSSTGRSPRLTPDKPEGAEGAGAAPTGGAAPSVAADGPGDPNARSRAEARFLAELQAAITALRYYPPSAQARRIEGQVTLGFVLAADGALSQPEVRTSSGHPILDEAAMGTLHRLGRFKPIPSEIRRTSWPIRVPIRFDLRQP